MSPSTTAGESSDAGPARPGSDVVRPDGTTLLSGLQAGARRSARFARHAVGRGVRIALDRSGYRLVRTRGRHATILPDDRLLVSYPRSGNTWVSFLLTNLTHTEPTTFLNLEERCPDVHKHDDPFLLRLATPRLMKIHWSFDPRFGRVLYLVRDPRDVVLSYHRYQQKVRAIGTDVPIDRFVDAFLDGTCNPGHSAWGEHVGSWCGARAGAESFLVLRYEDFHSDPATTLARAAEFLRIPASSEACERAVARASAEQMRQLEQREMRRVPGLMESRLEIPFIGPAEVGRGRRELSERDQERIALRWGRLTAELGYT